MDYIDCLVLTMVTNGEFVISESNDSPLFLTVALRIEEDFILFWFAVCHCLHSFYKAVCAQYVIILSPSVPKEQPCQGLLKRDYKEKATQ